MKGRKLFQQRIADHRETFVAKREIFLSLSLSLFFFVFPIELPSSNQSHGAHSGRGEVHDFERRQATPSSCKIKDQKGWF